MSSPSSPPVPASAAAPVLPEDALQRSARRGRWLRTLHQWHWVSSALSLAALLLFAVSGFTLNHADELEGVPRTQHFEAQLPPDLLASLQPVGNPDDVSRPADAPLPEPVRAWLERQWGTALAAVPAEWTPREVNVSLPRPGGDGWLRIHRRKGLAEYERSDRGWLAYLNDLHKGRETGPVWRAFIDLFALAVGVFAITGLLILKLHAVSRPLVWPLTAAGLVLPVVLALLFIH